MRNTGFYISSEINQDAKRIAQVIRGHWQVENNLHWQLDVSFREDKLRLRSGYAAENISFMNKLTISLLKKGNRIINFAQLASIYTPC